jgi:hypothetical protein
VIFSRALNGCDTVISSTAYEWTPTMLVGDQILRGVSTGEGEGRSTGSSGLERRIRADVRSTESRMAETESDEL